MTTPVLHAQDTKGPFSPRNSFGIFGEYSNDSSHILLGDAEQRKLLNFGASYSLRLVAGRIVSFQYYAEVRPVVLESDPLFHEKLTLKDSSGTTVNDYAFVLGQACRTENLSFSGKDEKGNPYTETAAITCARRWTFGEGMSPVGIKLNFLPRHRLQPVLTGMGGYMFSTQPIPVADAGSFNFTFEFGAGLEFYRSRKKSNSLFGNRSMRAEYRYHHISNHDTAYANPGIDNGMLQITYTFGR